MHCIVRSTAEMCFTVILVAWALLQVMPIVSTLPISNNSSRTAGHDVTLMIYKTQRKEIDLSKEKLKESILTIADEIRRLGTIPDCLNGDQSGPVCLRITTCTNPITSLNHQIPHEAIEDSSSPTTCFVLEYRASGDVHLEDNVDENEAEKPPYYKVWGFGIMTVAIISLSGLFGGILWPLMKSQYYDSAMRPLIGLAVGTLSATATLQLLPQGYGISEKDTRYLPAALVFLASLWVLYHFEVLCKIMFHQSADLENDGEKPTKELSKSPFETEEDRKLEQNGLLSKPVSQIISNNKTVFKPSHISSQTSLHKISTKHLHDHMQMGGIAPVAWMIILGDGLHNFIDGMSIGAGFTQSLAIGFSISIAIACEEFPHELGDFAILVNSGMKIKKALMYNFLSALTAFGGLVIGILLGEMQATQFIFAFSGGLFLYITLTDLKPELRKMIDESLKISKKNALLVLLQQNCGILSGYVLLYLITRYPINI